jgi:hypothetical protein
LLKRAKKSWRREEGDAATLRHDGNLPCPICPRSRTAALLLLCVLKCDDLSRIGGETPTPPSPTRLPRHIPVNRIQYGQAMAAVNAQLASACSPCPRVRQASSSGSRRQHHLRAPRAGVQSVVHAQLHYGSGWWALELEESKLSHPNQ